MRTHGKWIVMTVLPVFAALLVTGCQNTVTTHVEGLDKLGTIQAFTREADSGTRASFDDLIGTLTETEGLTEANSTEEMLSYVAGTASSIGYLTYGVADSSVKTLSIEGKDIGDTKYPLTRQLYLVYKGELSDLEREFITYVAGKGQDIVEQHFEPVGKANTFLSLKPAGSIKIGGSSSEAPLMEELAAAYQKENPAASITVETTDSGTGINGALEGSYDLGMSSRSPKDYEKNLLTFVPVAKDRIAVVVASDNPMTDISRDQLKSIYTGKVTAWSQLSG